MIIARCAYLVLGLIALLLGGCSSTHIRTGTPPQAFNYADARDVVSTTSRASNALEINQVITYHTSATPAELIQFYVNEANIHGWQTVTIMEPNRQIDLVSVQCPFYALNIMITQTTTLQQVRLDYQSELCQ